MTKVNQADSDELIELAMGVADGWPQASAPDDVREVYIEALKTVAAGLVAKHQQRVVALRQRNADDLAAEQSQVEPPPEPRDWEVAWESLVTLLGNPASEPQPLEVGLTEAEADARVTQWQARLTGTIGALAFARRSPSQPAVSEEQTAEGEVR